MRREIESSPLPSCGAIVPYGNIPVGLSIIDLNMQQYCELGLCNDLAFQICRKDQHSLVYYRLCGHDRCLAQGWMAYKEPVSHSIDSLNFGVGIMILFRHTSFMSTSFSTEYSIHKVPYVRLRYDTLAPLVLF